MDGYQVARRLRANQTLKECRLIAPTGYALTEDLRQAREAGFDMHLAKPLSIEMLEQALASPDRTEPTQTRLPVPAPA
jgi:CheY-like chemotaxis protein